MITHHLKDGKTVTSIKGRVVKNKTVCDIMQGMKKGKNARVNQ